MEERERTTTVESHAARTGEIVRLEATLLNELLGRDVARREQDGRGHSLGEQRPSGQLAIVPFETLSAHLVSIETAGRDATAEMRSSSSYIPAKKSGNHCDLLSFSGL